MDKELKTVLKVLGEKISELELMIYCKNARIEQLEKQLEEKSEEKEDK